MGICFESEKHKVAEGKGWALPSTCCIEDTVGLLSPLTLGETFPSHFSWVSPSTEILYMLRLRKQQVDKGSVESYTKVDASKSLLARLQQIVYEGIMAMVSIFVLVKRTKDEPKSLLPDRKCIYYIYLNLHFPDDDNHDV